MHKLTPLAERFTATHEVGHAIFDSTEQVVVSFTKSGKDLREVRANAFASNFRLPASLLNAVSDSHHWDARQREAPTSAPT